MNSIKYKPKHLPQISAPYSIVLQKLDQEGVDYDVLKINPNVLKPLQSITLNDKVEKVSIDTDKPIWISNDNYVLDGHHRMVRALMNDTYNYAIKINLNVNDACRILNKIQDIYDYENSLKNEDAETQDIINFYENDNDFLKMIENDNKLLQNSINGKNKQKILAYRKKPIKKNSPIGNFFLLEPIDEYGMYEIEFDNLFDTDMIGIVFKDNEEPVDVLSSYWFPNINFDKLSKQYDVPSIILKNRAIVEQAKRMGYDGIKYGGKIIQGLK